MSNTAATTSKNPFDIFIAGLRKGFGVAINNLMPNVIMAFVLAYILQLWGVLQFLGDHLGWLMGIWDLPGEALTVLCAIVNSAEGGVMSASTARAVRIPGK